MSRLLRGGVDWNDIVDIMDGEEFVASFAEAWIEIGWLDNIAVSCVVASFAEAWIEIKYTIKYIKPVDVASFAEAWIEI